ncbi:hypothetical protein [Bradyrhizobium sp. USDA 3364]
MLAESEQRRTNSFSARLCSFLGNHGWRRIFQASTFLPSIQLADHDLLDQDHAVQARDVAGAEIDDVLGALIRIAPSA